MTERLFATHLAGELLAADGASIVLAEWTDPGGGHEPPLYIAPLHVHLDDDEAWYVLEGVLGVRLGDSDVEVPAGGCALAPRGVAHTYWNPRPQPTRYLLIMTPAIKDLIDAIHELESRDADSLAATFAAHRSEYLGWP